MGANAFGVDHSRISKDMPGVGAIDDVATLPFKAKRAMSGGAQAAPTGVIPPGDAKKIKANIASIGDNSVAKSGSGQRGNGGPAIIGNGTEISKAKTFIPLKDVGRPAARTGIPAQGDRAAKIREGLRPAKQGLLRSLGKIK